MMTGLVRERDHYLGRLLFNQVVLPQYAFRARHITDYMRVFRNSV